MANLVEEQGPIGIRNPDCTEVKGADGKDLPWRHGVYQYTDGTLLPRYSIMGMRAARDGTVYVTTLAPFTLHAIRPQDRVRRD